MKKTPSSNTPRRRVVRALAAGLLNSSLTDEEISEALDLIDDSMVEELRSCISPAVTVTKKREIPVPERRQVADWSVKAAAMVVDLAKSKRMSRARFLSHIAAVSRPISSKLQGLDLSLGEIALEFTSQADQLSFNQLIARLSGQAKQDPFLIGITNRK